MLTGHNPRRLQKGMAAWMLFLSSQAWGRRGFEGREDNSCSKGSKMRLLFFCLVLHINLTLPLRQSSRAAQTLTSSKRRKFKKPKPFYQSQSPEAYKHEQGWSGAGEIGKRCPDPVGRETKPDCWRGPGQAGKREIPGSQACLGGEGSSEPSGEGDLSPAGTGHIPAGIVQTPPCSSSRRKAGGCSSPCGASETSAVSKPWDWVLGVLDPKAATLQASLQLQTCVGCRLCCFTIFLSLPCLPAWPPPCAAPLASACGSPAPRGPACAPRHRRRCSLPPRTDLSDRPDGSAASCHIPQLQ